MFDPFEGLDKNDAYDRMPLSMKLRMKQMEDVIGSFPKHRDKGMRILKDDPLIHDFALMMASGIFSLTDADPIKLLSNPKLSKQLKDSAALAALMFDFYDKEVAREADSDKT